MLRDIIKTICQVGGISLLMTFSFWFGLQCGKLNADRCTLTAVPTIEEIQRLVGANPDGKLGPETKAKWDRAICDQYAAKYFTAKDTEGGTK